MAIISSALREFIAIFIQRQEFVEKKGYNFLGYKRIYSPRLKDSRESCHKECKNNLDSDKIEIYNLISVKIIIIVLEETFYGRETLSSW